MLKDSLFTQLIESIYNNAVTLGTGLILLFAGQAMLSGNFSVGDFALFVFYLTFISDGIESFGNLLVYAKQSGVAFKRMASFIQNKTKMKLVQHKPIYLYEKAIPSKSPEATNKSQLLNRLVVKDLTYTHPRTGKGIKKINFTLNKGEVLVISGRTGSGKTTCIKTLLGLLPKDAGEVVWNQQLIKEHETHFVPPACAYTSQIPKLFSDTVKNNILLGLPEDQADLAGAIHAAVLEKDIASLDNGLETVIGPNGVNLSGGQKQRLAAARMFVRNPHLLIFDDISSALDIETEKELWKRLFAGKGPTCIIVSNRKFALEQADHILFMQEGTVTAQGRYDELMKRSKDFREMME